MLDGWKLLIGVVISQETEALANACGISSAAYYRNRPGLYPNVASNDL